MAQDLELRLRINASASEAIRSLLETRRSLADLAAQTQTAQARTAELARVQQEAQQRADELRVRYALASRELADLGQRVSRTSPEYRVLSAQIRQMAGDMREADRDAQRQTRAFEQARSQAAALSARMDELQQSSHRARQALQAQGVDVTRLASEYTRLRQVERQAAAERPLIADANRISQQYPNTAAVLARQQAELNAHLAAGRINQDTYNRALADYNRQAQTGVDNTHRLGSAIRTMGQIAASVFAVNSAFNLGRAIYQTSIEFQRIEGLLKTVTGSTEAANKQMLWLEETANRLGLSVASVSQQYGFYAAAAKEAGFSQDEINRVFYNFTSAISGLQLGQAQAERVMYALTQMTTKPKVALEELQLQLGDSLPGVIKKAARAVGISTEELYDKISKGQLVSAEFIKAFSQVLADDFPALTEGAAQSANRLENAWVKAKLEFGKGGFTDAVAQSLDKLTASIDGQTPALKAWSAALGDVITLLSAHGEEAGVGLSALLAGLRFGPIGAVIGGGAAAVTSAYVDAKKDAPDITFKPGDSAESLRTKLAGTQSLIKEFTNNIWMSDEEERAIISKLVEHKEKLLAELSTATAREQQGGAKGPDKFTFDPAKGFSQGSGSGGEQGRQNDSLSAQLDYQTTLIKNQRQQIEEDSRYRLRQIKVETDAKELALKQQQTDELITEKQLNEQLLIVKKEQSAQELDVKRETIEQTMRLDLAALDLKIAAEKTKVGQFGDLIAAAQEKYRLPEGLVQAVMQVESRGNPNAVSSAGAQGLMQLMPETAKGLGVKDVFDPQQNIEGGAKLLRELLDTFNGDVKKALAAYNSNPTKVKAAGDDLSQLPKETQAYVPAVLKEMGAPTGQPDAAQAYALNEKLKALYAQREGLEANKNAKLKELGLDQQRNETEQSAAELAIKQKTLVDQRAWQAELSQMQHDAALSDLDFKRQMADQELELGKITQAEHLARLKELAAEELALRLKILEDRRKLHLNDPVEQAKITAEQQQEMIKFRGDWSGLESGELKAAKNDLKTLFEPLQNALDQSINGILTGQQTITNAARNAAQSVVLSYVQQSIKIRAIKAQDWLFEHTGMAKLLNDKKQFDLLETVWDAVMWARKRVRKTLEWTWEISGLAGAEARKRAIKSASSLWEDILWAGKKAKMAAFWVWETLGFAAKETAKTGAQLAGDQIRVASSLAATGQTMAVETMAAETSIVKKAGSAAASVYESVAEIPIIGWILAPIAAAAAFMAVMAFGTIGSAKGGEYMVTEDGKPYKLHERESVLPAGVADNFRTVVDIVRQHVASAETLRSSDNTRQYVASAETLRNRDSATEITKGANKLGEGGAPKVTTLPPASEIGYIIQELKDKGKLSTDWHLPQAVVQMAQDSQHSAQVLAQNAYQNATQNSAARTENHYHNTTQFSPVYNNDFIDAAGAQRFAKMHARATYDQMKRLDRRFVGK